MGVGYYFFQTLRQHMNFVKTINIKNQSLSDSKGTLFLKLERYMNKVLTLLGLIRAPVVFCVLDPEPVFLDSRFRVNLTPFRIRS